MNHNASISSVNIFLKHARQIAKKFGQEEKIHTTTINHIDRDHFSLGTLMLDLNGLKTEQAKAFYCLDLSIDYSKVSKGVREFALHIKISCRNPKLFRSRRLRVVEVEETYAKLIRYIWDTKIKIANPQAIETADTGKVSAQALIGKIADKCTEESREVSMIKVSETRKLLNICGHEFTADFLPTEFGCSLQLSTNLAGVKVSRVGVTDSWSLISTVLSITSTENAGILNG